MRTLSRTVGAAMLLIGLGCSAARGSTDGQGAGATTPGHAWQCKAAGTQCRWDTQCLSGRCYVDLGCSG